MVINILIPNAPPVSTPTGYVNPAMGSTVTVTDPAPTTNTNKLTAPVTNNKNVILKALTLLMWPLNILITMILQHTL